MKYDIFISYRRKDNSGRSNVAMARQFKLAFEGPPYNYKVFFDFNECTDNYFSDIILPAIRTCDFFVLVLTKDCLLRCSNERDWVRKEIEEALANNRKIIPITPDNECNAWPNLPDSLRELDGLTITTIYTDHMFDACVDFLVKNRFHLSNDKSRRDKDQKAERERTAVEEKQNNTSQETTNTFNGHEYVDLGLPSGTLWATCNVGSSKSEDYGEYYSWDEGNKIAAQWGNGWSMPTKEQWEELMENTKSTRMIRNGVKGSLFTANNGNSLFLPDAGFLYEGRLQRDGMLGNYWSSSPVVNCSDRRAWGCCFASDYSIFGIACFCGLSIRPVCFLCQN